MKCFYWSSLLFPFELLLSRNWSKVGQKLRLFCHQKRFIFQKREFFIIFFSVLSTQVQLMYGGMIYTHGVSLSVWLIFRYFKFTKWHFKFIWIIKFIVIQSKPILSSHQLTPSTSSSSIGSPSSSASFSSAETSSSITDAIRKIQRSSKSIQVTFSALNK